MNTMKIRTGQIHTVGAAPAPTAGEPAEEQIVADTANTIGEEE
jgi:hypothetical protein